MSDFKPGRTLVLTILVGLLLTVGIAWACAIWSPFSPIAGTYQSLPDKPAPPQLSRWWIVMHTQQHAGFGIHGEVWRGEASGLPNAEEDVVVQAGWPLPALAWRTHADLRDYDRILTTPPNTWTSGICTRSTFSGGWIGIRERRLPLVPVWRGLLIDLALYSVLAGPVAIWLMRLATISARAFFARRGLCPYCRYNLHGLPLGTPCPECGRVSTKTTAYTFLNETKP